MTAKSKGSVRVKLHRARRKMLLALTRRRKQANFKSTNATLAEEKLS